MPPIPVLLLKTKSQPNDAYEEYFKPLADANAGNEPSTTLTFKTHFVPVLQHKLNVEALSRLGGMLKNGTLKDKYGGMIFTSQRAVEGWTDVVRKAENEGLEKQSQQSTASSSSRHNDPFSTMNSLLPFPIYTVGPATSQSLRTLLSTSGMKAGSPFAKLNASILGEETGNGANLAQYILKNYNDHYDEKYFTYFEAPRLPFIPLLGMSSENYGRKRLDAEDDRLQKKSLLFLVGEKRRDIIPKTLTDPTLRSGQHIDVEEVEVYSTTVMDSFQADLQNILKRLEDQQKSNEEAEIVIIVVFSPQGSDIMLRQVGLLNENNQPTEKSNKNFDEPRDGLKHIIVTIGPTTRDHLKDKFGLEPHICAEKPSPEGVGKGIEAFMKQAGLFSSKQVQTTA